MTIVHFIYVIVVLAVGGYILVAKRRFDYFSIGYLSAIYYTLPALLGFIEWDRSYFRFYQSEIPFEVHLSLIGFFLTLWLGAFLYDTRGMRLAPTSRFDERDLRRIRAMAEVSTVIAVGSFAWSIMANPYELLFNPRKVEWIEHTGRSYSIFSTSAMLAVITSTIAGTRTLRIAAVVLVALDLFIGFRKVFVLPLVSILAIWGAEAFPSRLISRWRIGLTGVGAMIFALIYKRIYINVKAGDWAGIIDRLTAVQDVKSLYWSSEGPLTFTVFVETVVGGLHLDANYALEQLLSVIPFAPLVGIDEVRGFNYYFQEPIMGVANTTLGLAQSNFGEAFALGGVVGVWVYAVFWVSAIYWMSAWTRSHWWYPIQVSLLGTLAFFGFRNGVSQILALWRREVLTGILIAAIAIAFLRIRRQLFLRGRGTLPKESYPGVSRW